MSGRFFLLGGIALAMMAGTASMLERFRTGHRLEPPGVRIVPVPVLNESSEAVRSNSVYLPSMVSGWRSGALPMTQLELDYLPKDTTYARRRYDPVNGGGSVQVSVVLMGTDRTSIHRPEYCLTGQGWGIERRTSTTVRIQRGGPYDLPIRRYDAVATEMVDGHPETVKGIYLFWFVADRRVTADAGQRMWWMATHLIRHGALQRWAYVSCFTKCRPGEEEAAFQRTTRLVSEMVPDFQTVPSRP